jgi:tRNA pseudouridine38-40 synthase
MLRSRHTYRVTLAYDGGAFWGFSQQRGLRTVESTLVTALRPLLPELPRVAVGGRTDRGVHAVGQVVSFWSRGPLRHEDIADAIDGAAPGELCVRDVREVPRRFHAGFSASFRHYAYRLRDDGRFDAERLDALLAPLVGRRCFGVFARDTATGASTVRRLRRASARRDGLAEICFDFVADGFLRRQVRVMVATALREQQRGAPEDALLTLCRRGDRGATARPVDAAGLYLVAVGYPAEA